MIALFVYYMFITLYEGAAAVILANDPGLTPSEVKEALQLKSIGDAVQDPKYGSPNLLLYIGEGSGGGFLPTPPPPPPGN